MVESIIVKGSPYEMGFSQGEQLKEKINAMLDYVLHSEMFSEVKPKIIPIWLVKFALGLYLNS